MDIAGNGSPTARICHRGGRWGVGTEIERETEWESETELEFEWETETEWEFERETEWEIEHKDSVHFATSRK